MAIATEAGSLNSGVAAATYVITPTGTLAAPKFSLLAGTYTLKTTTSTLSDTLSDATSGATICYTTNGNTPLTSAPGVCSTTVATEVSVPPASQPYSLPIATAETVTAIATSAAYPSNSAVTSAVYNIVPPAPTFSPGSEAFYQSYVTTSYPSVTIAAATGAAITYCEVAAGSAACTPGTALTNPLSVSCVSGNPPCGVTVYANAAFTGGSASSTSKATYTIKPGDPPGTPHAATPTLSPAPGTITAPVTVTITGTTLTPPGVAPVICYTLNGPVPQVSPTATTATPVCTTGTVYTAGIPIGTTQTATAGSETGTTVTLTFGSNAFVAGSQMTCTGFTPSGYNGTWEVAASPAPTGTQVSFAAPSGLAAVTTPGSCFEGSGASYTIRAVAGGAGYLPSEPIAKGDYNFR